MRLYNLLNQAFSKLGLISDYVVETDTDSNRFTHTTWASGKIDTSGILQVPFITKTTTSSGIIISDTVTLKPGRYLFIVDTSAAPIIALQIAGTSVHFGYNNQLHWIQDITTDSSVKLVTASSGSGSYNTDVRYHSFQIIGLNG